MATLNTTTPLIRQWRTGPLRRAAAALLLSLLASAGHGKSFNGAEITQAAMGCTDCLDWRVTGICFWLDCGWFGCSINTTIKVSHWIPDLAVASYSGGESPWSETQSWNMDEATVISHQSNRQGDTNADFKKVDVIGHPATLVFKSLSSTGLFCQSCATAYQPYFISRLDRLGWHSGIPEMFNLDTWTGRRVMGTTTVRFGNIYPRTGWSVHSEDPKSAALTAQRAADLVTSRERAARVYQPVGTDCGNKCWAPPPVRENNSSTHRWQMMTPVEQDGWEIFGQRSGWANGKYDGSERYAWSLWRPYTCCQSAGSYITSVNW